ncbi:MAG TPA: hypothetical protein VG405_10195 [Solirubrobacteraceae bacterium]|jgi:hypothetical protein|nr:hypothetical protein [Solirubrobacteraceae bacterium]
MPQHPALYEVLARERQAEFQRTADTTAYGRSRRTRPQLVTSARKATGWFLVEVGLRLAVSRRVTRSA